MIDIENAERFILFALIKCGRGAFFDEAIGIRSLPF